jgi:transglycosylase-like protein with SLT domain
MAILVAGIGFLNAQGDLFSYLSDNQKEVRLIKQQHVTSFLCGNLGKIVLIVVLGAAFFGAANLAQAVHKAHAQTASPSVSSVDSVIQNVFGANASAAMNVAQCESSENPNAVNPTPVGSSYAEGLFQILYPSTWNTTSQASNSPLDATANAIAAHEIFVRDGYSWREWACQP